MSQDNILNKISDNQATSFEKLAETFRSNLEIFAIAFMLAMIIRCFCVEVFKIPTGSMEPTLLGSDIDGDRIIANKFQTLFTPIKRYDVILFKYPLNKTVNFIKRVVGLPGEEMMVYEGDIYFRPRGQEGEFQLAAKPLDVQESIWIPVLRWENNFRTLINNNFEFEKEDGPVNWQGDSVLLAGEAASEKLIRYKKYPVDDEYKRGNNGNHGYNNVYDFKLAFRFKKITEAPGIIKILFTTRYRKFEIQLSDSKNNLPESGRNSFIAITDGNDKVQTTSLPAAFSPAEEHFVEILNFDGMLCLKLDRQVVYQQIYQPALAKEQKFLSNKKELLLGVAGTKALFRDINIYRDIYYVAEGVLDEGKSFFIEPHKYFMMGDNVHNSKDSRKWKKQAITLKNGEALECDTEYYSKDSRQIKILRDWSKNKGGDVWGVERIIPLEQVNEESLSQSYYYGLVDESEIFGKALFVYWPLGRAKIIK